MKKQSAVSLLIAVIAVAVAAHIILMPHTVATEILSAEEEDGVVVSEAPSTPTPTPEVVVTSSPSQSPAPTQAPSPTPMPAPTPSTPSPPLTPDEYIATDGQQYAYVPGFGYIPSGGESQVASVPGMVENGNKIGSMG